MSTKTRLITIEKDEKEIFETAEKATKKLEKNNKITLTNFIGLPTMTYVLFQELFRYIGEHPDKEINFLELFSVGKDEEGVFLCPGPGMKLEIKSDEETETSEEEED